MQLDQQTKKTFRTIGHRLKPVVTIAEKGLTESVCQELERALNDHELIKVKLAVGRDNKQAIIDRLQKEFGSVVVQAIGNVVLIYRATPKPNPKLSNVLRNPSNR